MEPAEMDGTAEEFGGIAPPSGAKFPVWMLFEHFFRNNLTFIVFGCIALYFVYRHIARRMQDARDRIPVGGPAPPPSDNFTDEERILAARMHQQKLVEEAAARDCEIQQELAAKRVQEELKKRDKREGRETVNSGRRVEQDSEDTERELKKLPKLPAPDQDRYAPYQQGETSTRYRPSGFRRPKPKGG